MQPSLARIPIVAGLLAALLAAVGAHAHDYWIEPESDAQVLYQGHLYSSHAGEQRVPCDPAIVRAVECLRASGERASLPRPAGYPLRLPGGCAAVLVETSSGYWAQTLTGTVNKPKTEVFGALRGWLSQESIKLVNAWLPALAAPLGDGLELVPLADPRAVAPGDKLRLLVTWQRRPRAGATVAYQGDARGVTGADGTINIRLRAAGRQVISASVEEPLADPRADRIVRATILQFDLLTPR
jgi:uncharacterized GH25 family protein